ncbi:hypothetical protein M501DRAFT_1005758 [Patellaria atrata CBS 101060]|uniref:Cyclin-L2 n=1 Tax=Patellaria atrata CBS 101060 TaxID=1346257 RepID=A0A9P4VV24_9PEZI|nr:hypothetical protein M501DRAFT_1005758 [Patellaria atrata CBS 101060]
MAPETKHLANPLASVEQLASSGSQLDGIPSDLEDSVRFAGARLLQCAGILLKLPQQIIAQAILIFTRFWVGSEGGSMRDYGAEEVSSASLYLIAKLSPYPKSPRSIINIYVYLGSLGPYVVPAKLSKRDADIFYLSEENYQEKSKRLMFVEAHILRILGFQTHVALPHTLLINYLQTLDIFQHPSSSELAKRAMAHLNTALLSPQLLYLTHQPSSLATAAIYLAAREVGVKLPQEEWWEVFDTDREELGFLVVGMLSVEGFVKEEFETWDKRSVPLTVDGVETQLELRKGADG